MPLNHPLIALPFTLMYLMFLFTLVAYNTYSTLSQLITRYTCLVFKVPTIRWVQLLIQQGDYAFSIDLKDVYSYIPILKHHHHFYAGQHKPYQRNILPFWPATALGFLHHLLNPYCSFAIRRVFMFSLIWMLSWLSIILSMLAREFKPSCTL